MNDALFWWMDKGIYTDTDSATWSFSTQRENDQRVGNVATNLTRYYEILELTWSWNWSGDLTGSLNQTIELFNSAGQNVYSRSRSGSSGSETLTNVVAGLDPDDTYYFRVTAQSSISGQGYHTRAASGSASWTYLTDA